MWKNEGSTKHKETWSWNDEVKGAVEEKRNRYLVWKNLKDEISRKAYNRSKCEAKKVISRVKEEQRLRFVEDLEKQDKQGNLFRAVKQMTLKNKDIVGGGCIKDSSGNLVVDGCDIKQVWKNYYDKLLNEEFDWNRDLLDTACQWKDQANSFPSMK